jgi:two-component system sensor histidine kinase/response regulator
MKLESSAEQGMGDSELSPAKVLAVDDTPANLMALSGLLARLGCEIVLAASGAEALHIATRDEFAVILLDVMMPGMDGFETLARLRMVPATSRTPVILITAYDLGLREIERAYALGAVDYVAKPISPKVLRGKVAAFVAVYRSGQELRRRTAARDRQISVLAHDLSNPLAAIETAAEALRRAETGKSVESARVIAQRLERAAARMTDMIRDLLDYARVGIDDLPIVPGPTDIGDLCRELVEEFHLADSSQQIDLICTDTEELRGQWDRARIFQALSNLVRNATTYGKGRVTIRARRKDDVVHVAVQNDGPPIAADFLTTIFEPFERGTQEGKGLGLGLYIVREIARSHGGDVSVTSSPGDGTTFTLLLPCRKSAPGNVVAPAGAGRRNRAPDLTPEP